MAHTLLQISDTHLLETPNDRLYGNDVDRNLDAVVSAAAAFGPFDVALLTGDISQDGSADSYQRAKTIVEKARPQMIWATPGNHDRPDAIDGIFDHGGVRPLGSWRIHLISSHYDEHVEGWVTDDDLAHSARTIADEPDAHHMIAVHHPPVHPCANLGCSLANADVVRDFAVQHDVRLVVSGHVHDDYLHTIERTTFATCPSTCIGYVHDPVAHRASPLPPGATVIKLFDDGSVARRVVYAEPA